MKEKMWIYREVGLFKEAKMNILPKIGDKISLTQKASYNRSGILQMLVKECWSKYYNKILKVHLDL